MRYSQIKELFESFDRETIEKIIENKDEIDFSSSTHRFIQTYSELDVVEKSYAGDYDTLGRFGVDYIVDNTSIPQNKVEELVAADEFEKLGKIISKLVGVREFLANALIDEGIGALLNAKYHDRLSFNRDFYVVLYGTEYTFFEI